MNTNDWGDVIAREARKWDGIDFRPGVREQCCNWVRAVLEHVRHPYAARVTKEPLDGHWTGSSLASSLAGRDLGNAITKFDALEPGDLVFWNDTYATGFPAGTITHIGIALGPDEFIHRNTMAAPVNRKPFTGFWRDQFRCGIRVPQAIKPEPNVKAPAETATTKAFQNANGGSLQIRQAVDRRRYSLFTSGNATDGGWMLKWVDRKEGAPTKADTSRLWVNTKGATLELRQDLEPGSYSLVSAGTEEGALLVKLVPRK